jgi:putative ABC transport system substrate-binding protein
MLFTSRLRELGWTDGENLQINYRFGTGEAMSVGAMAKELVNQHPDALFAITSTSALALRQYTLTIPTVFVQVGDLARGKRRDFGVPHPSRPSNAVGAMVSA